MVVQACHFPCHFSHHILQVSTCLCHFISSRSLDFLYANSQSSSSSYSRCPNLVTYCHASPHQPDSHPHSEYPSGGMYKSSPTTLHYFWRICFNNFHLFCCLFSDVQHSRTSKICQVEKDTKNFNLERQNSMACKDTETTLDLNFCKIRMPDENITDQQNKDGLLTDFWSLDWTVRL